MLESIIYRTRLLVAGMLALLVLGCQPEQESALGEAKIFNPVDTSFTTDSLILPAGGAFRFEVLMREGDPVKVDWKQTVGSAKGAPDFLAFLPLNGASSHGILWLNHETTSPDPIIGDGGGASLIEVFRDSLGDWKAVGLPHAINFDPVGGTLANCLGVVTPWGTILTSEEIEPMGSQGLREDGKLMITDTSSFDGRSRWRNYGWMVEVDPWKQEVLGKRWSMGRFMHEGALVLPDERTVYLMDDDAPGVFFKFVADQPRKLDQGQLFAWMMEADTLGRHWLPLTRDRDSLVFARRLALQRGASVFLRLEDIEMLADGSMLITETGKDSVDLSQAISWGGKVMPHLAKYHLGNQVYKDYFGRILRYDPASEHFSVFLEGGAALENKSIVLSNPDNLAIDHKRQQLYIVEDLNGRDGGRVPNWTGAGEVNEIYCLDLSIQNPKLDDLRRFAVMPKSVEGSGLCFNPDGSAMFLNLQFESPATHRVFNRSMTLVISGFPE